MLVGLAVRAGSESKRWFRPVPILVGSWPATGWHGPQDYRIVASHDTLAAVIDQVNREGLEGVFYERLPNRARPGLPA